MNRYARPENFGHPIRNPLLRQHFVYRAFAADGYLLYVGCTYVPDARLVAHRNESRWFSQAVAFKVAGPFNYETARQIEYDAIEGERPQFNHTREKRTLDAIRSRMVSRQIGAAVATGADVYESIGPAVEVVDMLLPDGRYERMTDLMLPNARRIERMHMNSLASAS